MKYWVFQSNQVSGPFEPEDLTQLPGYSGETLVCPEGRKGTSMGDWQRASMVPELSVSILKAGQLALAGKSSGGYASLPPEPTLKDLAALGSLQEKVSLLDNTVAHLQESLRLKDEELLSVHKELEDKARHAQELNVKLGGLEERLTAVNVLKEGLDKAVAAEHDTEEVVQKQAALIDELKSQLAALKDEQKRMDELKKELGRLKEDQEHDKAELQKKLADAAEKAEKAEKHAELAEKTAEQAAKAPAPALPSAAPLNPAPGSLKPEGLMGLPSERPNELKPQPLGDVVPAKPVGDAIAREVVPPKPLEPISPLGSSVPPVPAPMGGAPFGAPATATPEPAAGFGLPAAASLSDPLLAPTPAAEPVATPAAAAKPAATDAPAPAPAKKKGAKLVLAGVALLAIGGAAAVKLGMVGGKKHATLADTTPLPPPAAPVEPKGPTPEELLEQQKTQAIEAAKAFMLPDGTALSMKLEKVAPPAQDGGLNPWMADKIRDGAFQVNYYSPKDGKRPAQTFEFEVSIADGKVLARNAAAAGAMTAKTEVAEKPAKKGKVAKAPKIKIKPKAEPADDNPLLQDLLDVSEDPAPAKPQDAQVSRKKAKAPAVEEGGGDVMIDGSGAGAQGEPQETVAAKPQRKARRPKPVDKKAVEKDLNDLLAEEPKKKAAAPKEESLDELLLPGVPKRGDAAPRAEPSAPAEEPMAAPSDESAPAEEVAASRPKRGPAPKPQKKAAAGSDAELLDDLLKP